MRLKERKPKADWIIGKRLEGVKHVADLRF